MTQARAQPLLIQEYIKQVKGDNVTVGELSHSMLETILDNNNQLARLETPSHNRQDASIVEQSASGFRRQNDSRTLNPVISQESPLIMKGYKRAS